MATSWRRTAAVLLSAACAAIAVPDLPGRASSARPQPATASTAERPLVVRLRLPDLPLPPEALSRLRPAPAPATHRVVAGDTLWAIARSAGVGVEALAAANHLSETSILPLGLVLMLPPAGASSPGRSGVVRAATSGRAPVPARTAAASVRPAQAQSAAGHLALLWPSGGVVTSRFGWRVHPIFGRPEFHTGMDIATRYGSNVVAARGGVVCFVGWKSGYGRIIVLQHDGGIETSYSHLSAALVNPGQHVAQGQVIGRVGNSGWSTGPHLFFEVRRNGVPVDPARYLR